MMTKVIHPWLPELLRIARAAGEAICAIYHQPTAVDVFTKADDTPVTAADQAAHELILAALARFTPDIPVLSEEGLPPPFAERCQWSRYWLVDPLDGTREFIQRTGEFTVNIALVEQQRPVLGVVVAPVQQQAYVAARGRGAFRIEGDRALPIRVRPVQDRTVRVIASRRHGNDTLGVILQRFEQQGWRVVLANAGSSLKFCRIAEGNADCYPRLGPTSEWDTAAAQVILEEAGGCVVDTAFVPLHYNRKDSLLNPPFLALGAADFPWRACLSALP